MSQWGQLSAGSRVHQCHNHCDIRALDLFQKKITNRSYLLGIMIGQFEYLVFKDAKVYKKFQKKIFLIIYWTSLGQKKDYYGLDF